MYTIYKHLMNIYIYFTKKVVNKVKLNILKYFLSQYTLLSVIYYTILNYINII